MTPSTLRAEYEDRHPNGHFFTRANMRFSGDTMSNYAVSTKPVSFTDYSGDVVTCWELRRKRPVKHGLQSPAYFDCNSFRLVHRPVAQGVET